MHIAGGPGRKWTRLAGQLFSSGEGEKEPMKEVQEGRKGCVQAEDITWKQDSMLVLKHSHPTCSLEEMNECRWVEIITCLSVLYILMPHS